MKLRPKAALDVRVEGGTVESHLSFNVGVGCGRGVEGVNVDRRFSLLPSEGNSQ